VFLDADDLQDRDQPPLLGGEPGVKAALQVREQHRLYPVPDLCYLHHAFASWLVLIAHPTKIPPGGESTYQATSATSSKHN
jgi:hypothetical protein